MSWYSGDNVSVSDLLYCVVGGLICRGILETMSVSVTYCIVL